MQLRFPVISQLSYDLFIGVAPAAFEEVPVIWAQ
jgi:hypothetical protein